MIILLFILRKFVRLHFVLWCSAFEHLSHVFLINFYCTFVRKYCMKFLKLSVRMCERKEKEPVLWSEWVGG